MYRSGRGGRRSRLFAPALRQAQLAEHRRDAPLDRGNRRGGDEASGRTAPATGDIISLRSWTRTGRTVFLPWKGLRVIMPLWLSPQPLVLASKSEVRGKMLAAAGLRIEIRPAPIDERAAEAKAGTTDAAAIARHLARAKANAVAPDVPGYLVLGADQTLARGSARFSKPADRAEALEQLRSLRGRTHELHSALALVRDGKLIFDCVDSARLTMRNVSDRFLEDYLDMAGDT